MLGRRSHLRRTTTGAPYLKAWLVRVPERAETVGIDDVVSALACESLPAILARVPGSRSSHP